MPKYLFYKLSSLIIAFFITSILIFFALHILPGDIAVVLGGTQMDSAQTDFIRHQLGLDKPLFVQYIYWIMKFIRFDFGTSQISGYSLSSEIIKAANVSIPLILISFFLALLIGVGLTFVLVLLSKTQIVKKSFIDKILLFISCQPALWLSLIIMTFLAKGFGVLNLLPVSGFDGGFDALIMPSLVCGIIIGAKVFRVSFLQIVSKNDFVRNYAAVGHSIKFSLIRSGFRASLTPVISVSVILSAELITSVIVLEKLFSLNGWASLLLLDVQRRDILAVQSEIMLLVVFVLMLGFILDLVLGLIDPRVRLGRKGDAL